MIGKDDKSAVWQYQFLTVEKYVKNRIMICSRKVCQVNINVRNVNDWKPIAPITQSISISEDTKPGTIIGQVNATDFDKRNKFTFRLLGQESEWFKVHRRSGKIQLLMALDREISDYYRPQFYRFNCFFWAIFFDLFISLCSTENKD